MLEMGDLAPDFSLPDKDGNVVQLADFLGKKVVLYFYPKDETPGCTKQACAFRNVYDDFKERDIPVMGISKDTIASHNSFASKHELPFLLLSDENRKAIDAYGVWVTKVLFGKKSYGISRTTFVINEEGYIEKVFSKPDPTSNAQDVLDYLDAK